MSRSKSVENKSTNIENKNITTNDTCDQSMVAARYYDNFTRYPGEMVYSVSTGMTKKGVRAFIIVGMKDDQKSIDILQRMISDCSLYFKWDHVSLEVRKVIRPDGKANFRIETIHTNESRLRKISELLKMSGAIESVYEDISQRKNILV